jgi:hypothetical protein
MRTPMLAYLDALLAALAARDIAEIDRLLAHPLARILSPDALADATAERRAAGTGTPSGMPSVAPLRLLQLRYRTAQLLSEHVLADAPEPDASAEHRRHPPQEPAWSDRRPAVRHQMELPLSA